jgi:hypothetical protein
MNRLFIPIFFILSLFVFSANADWVKVEYTYNFGPDISETEACSKAEGRAKIKALKSVSGEKISSEDNMVCSEMKDEAECSMNRYTWSGIDGLITGTRNRTENVGPGIKGHEQCKVTIEVNVGVAEGNPDPSFDLGVKLNQSTFRHGEALKINLSPTQSMHIYVFQYLPYMDMNKQVTRIFPNPFDKDQLFPKVGSVPTQEGGKRYAMSVGFPEGVKKPKDLVDEYLMVLGTRKAISFRDEYSLEEFNARLSEIPRHDRRVVKKAYNVVRTK